MKKQDLRDLFFCFFKYFFIKVQIQSEAELFIYLNYVKQVVNLQVSMNSIEAGGGKRKGFLT
jgi:hypothetical protein